MFYGAKLRNSFCFWSGGETDGMRCELGCEYFYHKVHGVMSKKWWRFEGSEEHWKLWRCEVKHFVFWRIHSTMLRFVQNDRVLFGSHGLEICAISVLKRKDFYSHYVFNGKPKAKEEIHGVSKRCRMMMWLVWHVMMWDVRRWCRIWRMWRVKLWNWNLCWYKGILH